jgi:hypothetical protein
MPLLCTMQLSDIMRKEELRTVPGSFFNKGFQIS